MTSLRTLDNTSGHNPVATPQILARYVCIANPAPPQTQNYEELNHFRFRKARQEMNIVPKRRRKKMYPKAAVLHAMKRKGEKNTSARRNTHHGGNTKSEGSTQVLVTPITLNVDTHTEKAHRHYTVATTRRPQCGGVNETPMPSPSKRRNDGSPSRTRWGKRPAPHLLDKCYVTASEQSYTRAGLWLYRTLDL